MNRCCSGIEWSTSESPTGYQPEVARVWRNGYISQPAEESVKQIGRRPLVPAFARSRNSLAVDHVRFFASHHRHHRAKQFRRILQIGVDDQDAVPAAHRQVRAVTPADARDYVTDLRRRHAISFGELANVLPRFVG